MVSSLVMEFFNHESPRRGETFVTRKITRGYQNKSWFRKLFIFR